MGASALPNAKDDDTDDVRWALETANAMWGQGDLREALRWIRRAAETAAGDGLDLRAVELAKTAAALRTELDIPQTMPPPAIAANAAPVEAPPPPGAPRFEPEAPPPPAPPPPAAAATPPPPAAAAPPPPPAAAAPPPPPAAAAPPPPPVDPAPAPALGLGGTVVLGDARPRIGTEPGLSPSQAPPAGGYQALRVAVARGADGALAVRPLEPGATARAGEHEAMLVALTPNVRLGE